jgi:hypothetical protein
MKSRWVWTFVVGASLALFAVVAFVLYAALPVLQGDPAGADPVRIDVAAGTALRDVAAALQARGVVRHRGSSALCRGGFDRQIRW